MIVKVGLFSFGSSVISRLVYSWTLILMFTSFISTSCLVLSCFSSLSFLCSRCPALIPVYKLVVEPNFIERNSVTLHSTPQLRIYGTVLPPSELGVRAYSCSCTTMTTTPVFRVPDEVVAAFSESTRACIERIRKYVPETMEMCVWNISRFRTGTSACRWTQSQPNSRLLESHTRLRGSPLCSSCCMSVKAGSTSC
jgi:hypothetical protein